MKMKNKIEVYQGSQADKELAQEVALQLGGVGFNYLGVVDPGTHFVVIGDERAALKATIEARSRNAVIHHLYAGDRSGCQDDYYRDAISALSDYLYAVSASSYCRAVLMSSRMRDQIVMHCKHPIPEPDTTWWEDQPPYVYARFHPNTLDPDESTGDWIKEVIDRARSEGLKVWLSWPNSDKGSGKIKDAINSLIGDDVQCIGPSARPKYIGMLQHAQWIAGNSSSFLYDVPPEDRHKVTLYGNRQQNRVPPDAPKNAPTFGEAIMANIERENA